MLDESCSSSSLRPTLTLVARSSSYFLSLAPLLHVARGLSQGTWNMTRARMRQHEYYFIVQRRLARHYCWLELLSRPTSVMAHDTVSCVCLPPPRRRAAAGCRPRISSRPAPVLYGICVARFLCIVRSCAGLPGYNRRAHTTRDSRHLDRREFDVLLVCRERLDFRRYARQIYLRVRGQPEPRRRDAARRYRRDRQYTLTHETH